LIGIYLVFVAATAFISRDSHQGLVQVRYFAALLLVVAFFGISLSRKKKWPYEAFLLVGSVLAGTIEILGSVWTGDSSEAHGQAAILFVLVTTNTVLRLRPTYAVIALMWGLTSEGLILACAPTALSRKQIFEAAFVLTVSFLTAMANYSQDREARLAFLKFCQKTEMVGSLSRQNQDLALAAQTDSLTGIFNRSSLDNSLRQIWSHPTLSTAECSIIMTDIDHFKSINDRYGHLYGDRVIKRVAHLLSEALRGRDDVIARYGGDEFVLILPNPSVQPALKVAERLRALVELAGLPSLRSDDPDLQGLRATISCGVASGSPDVIADPYILLGEADEALYRAKREGRNLVGERADQTAEAKPSDSVMD